MKLNKKTKIGIVGLGLIGGSYAVALSDQGFTVGAIDPNSQAINFAMEKHWIAHGKTVPDPEYLQQFDLIVFALYPHTFVDWIREYGAFLKENTVLTDVTGVKGGVVREIQSLLPDGVELIAAHPMAGREMSGVENAKKEIFYDANYIVTPTEKNTESAITLCRELGETLGFKTVTTLSLEKHDEMIGFLSQLTHCIAVSLMTCRDTACLAEYSGDSFRDLTRIAKINDEMWSELFLLNKDQLLQQMDLFDAAFGQLRNAIANDNREEIRERMRLSTRCRELFDKKGD